MAPPQSKSSAQEKKTPQTFGELPAAGKIGLLVGMLAVLSLIYYFALHMPLADEIDAAQGRHTALLQELEQAKQKQREYIELREQLAARVAIDRQNKRILPEQAEIAAFLQDLNNKAELSGLRMLLVEPKPEETAEFYVKIPVDLELEGRYHQLARFFYTVGRIDRAISMENIRLQDPHTSEENDDVKLHVKVLATTYRQPTPAEAAPPTAPATPGATP